MRRLFIQVFPEETEVNILDMSLFDEGKSENIKVVKYAWEDDTFPRVTLRDISILLGENAQGILWQLAKELSERLNVPYGKTFETLCDITDEYANLSEEAADRRWEKNEMPPSANE